MKPFFSIIVVTYNAGPRLAMTVNSILAQSCGSFEILVKDGGSSDGSLQQCPEDARIRIFAGKDRGIYDAMNFAVRRAEGEFVYFLNTGDLLADAAVLEKVRREILRQCGRGEGNDERSGEPKRQEGAARQEGYGIAGCGAGPEGQGGGNRSQTVRNVDCGEQTPVRRFILYGDVLERRSGQVAAAKPVMDDFALFRNVPCHQACFYSRDLFTERGFDTGLTVRADYEHFLWCHYRAGARMVYFPETIAEYEGGGFSETKRNRAVSAQEHRMVTQMYMPMHKVLLYRAYLILTLQPLREKIAANPHTALLYDAVRRRRYHRK